MPIEKKIDDLAKEVKEIKEQTKQKPEKTRKQESSLFVPPHIRVSVYIYT